MINQFILAFAIAALLAVGATPLVMRLARMVGAVDKPDKRKIHSTPMPRLGGAAVFFGFITTTLFFFIFRSDIVATPWTEPYQGVVLLIASLMIIALGIWDDIKQLGPGLKFVLQVAISSIVWLAGIRITVIAQPLGGGDFMLGLLSYPATILWIVGIMNAVNLIDGLDGLASGVAMIASVTIGAIAFVKFSDTGTPILAVALAGALFGFLRYNFNPAKIFLGDSGSLFLGFALAVMSLVASVKGSAAFAILIPAISLGLPILDTSLAMLRRLVRPFMKKNESADSTLRHLRSMFLPDRDHIHHRLLALGLTHRKAVLLLYLVTSALGCGAFGLTVTDTVGQALVLSVAGMAMMAGIHRLRYQEFAILRRGVFLPLYDHPIVQNALFQAIIDTAMSLIAFAAAFSIAMGLGIMSVGVEQYRYLLFLVPVMQMVVFFVSGMYRTVLRHAGIDDMMRVIKSVGISVIFGGLVFAALGHPMSEPVLRLAIFDFFFLTSLLVFSRFSYVVLREMARDTMEGKDPVIVYGAGDRGVAAMRALLAAPELHMRPVGFLDDDARVEGKKIHGLPVFGGHWRLERLIISRDIKAVVIAADSIHPVAQRRIKLLSMMYRVPVRVFGATFTDLPVEVVEAPNFRVHVDKSTETPLDQAHQQLAIRGGGAK